MADVVKLDASLKEHLEGQNRHMDKFYPKLLEIMDARVKTFMDLEKEVTNTKKALTSAWEFRFTELFMNSDTKFSNSDFKALLTNRKKSITEEGEKHANEAVVAQAVQQQVQAELQHKMTDPSFMANMMTNPQVQQAIMQAMSGGGCSGGRSPHAIGLDNRLA